MEEEDIVSDHIIAHRKVSVDRLFVFQPDHYKSIPFSNIQICFFENGIVRVVAEGDEVYSTTKTINEISSKLPEKDFFQVNRGCVLSFHAIDRVEQFFGQRLIVTTTSRVMSKVVVSRSRVSGFKEWLGF